MNIQVKKIRKLYKEILKQIHDMTQNIDITQSDNILKIINMTNINNQFNTIDYWDKFKPDVMRPYSILNTDKESDIGHGTHWVGCYQDYNHTIYIYDSFARKNIMKDFIKQMKKQGFTCFYTNLKTDQQNEQIDCGIRSMLWLLFVDKYNIEIAGKI